MSFADIPLIQTINAQPDDNSSSDSSGVWTSDMRGKESIEIGDKIKYWLPIHVWGNRSTMRSSKVVKIEPAKDMYEPHLHLENGDTVLFGSMIQNVKESIDDNGTSKTLTKKNKKRKRWRGSDLYDCKPSEDTKAYRRSITRDSDMFKKIVSTAQKIAEDRELQGEKNNKTGFRRKESDASSESSQSVILGLSSSGSDSYDDNSSGSESSSNTSDDSSDEDINLPTNKDINGLILGPECSQKCFLSNKKCQHNKEQVAVNKPGDYLAFNPTWWHHRYFKHVTNLTYFTAQLFCVPSRQLQCTQRVHRTTTRLDKYVVGHLNEAVISGLTRDLVSKWDDNDDHGFSVKKFPPTKEFLGKGIDKTKNRYIRFKDIAKLPRLQRVTTEIEDRIGNITVDSVWLIKKMRTDDGFQEWHQDMKHNITTTVIVNVGVVMI